MSSGCSPVFSSALPFVFLNPISSSLFHPAEPSYHTTTHLKNAFLVIIVFSSLTIEGHGERPSEPPPPSGSNLSYPSSSRLCFTPSVDSTDSGGIDGQTPRGLNDAVDSTDTGFSPAQIKTLKGNVTQVVNQAFEKLSAESAEAKSALPEFHIFSLQDGPGPQGESGPLVGYYDWEWDIEDIGYFYPKFDEEEAIASHDSVNYYHNICICRLPTRYCVDARTRHRTIQHVFVPP